MTDKLGNSVQSLVHGLVHPILEWDVAERVDNEVAVFLMCGGRRVVDQIVVQVLTVDIPVATNDTL